MVANKVTPDVDILLETATILDAREVPVEGRMVRPIISSEQVSLINELADTINIWNDFLDKVHTGSLMDQDKNKVIITPVTDGEGKVIGRRVDTYF